ncbi:MAG TPA: Trk system potassium transporter TrkA [Acidimicrobiia bacterium]|nr:Trk system potassium transporter TrkA [Acidimicrobiia bacterium]
MLRRAERILKILIVGAGAVGSYLAERLSSEGLEVVLIENDEHVAAGLQERLDAMVIAGNGSSAAVLSKAGAARADLLIAVSNSDGANIIACHTARQLGTRRTVARIEDPGLREGVDALGVDVVIDPGATAAAELVSLVHRSGVSELIGFAEGKLMLVGGTVKATSELVGKAVSQVHLREAHWGWVLAAVVRHGLTIIAHEDTVVEPGDHALIMVAEPDVEKVLGLLGLRTDRIRRVAIFGSTRLAELTAAGLLEAGFQVAIVDEDAQRCVHLSGRFPKAVVMKGDPTDPEVLRDLDLSDEDVVFALTGWDEVNVLSCLVAKSLGAARVIARFNRLSLVNLLTDVGIDGAISSRLLAASAILRFVRQGRIHQVATFSDSDAEAIEIEVEEGSEAADQRVIDLDLPNDVVVGGISRRNATFIPDGSTVIRAGDNLIFFSLPARIEETSALFARPT